MVLLRQSHISAAVNMIILKQMPLTQLIAIEEYAKAMFNKWCYSYEPGKPTPQNQKHISFSLDNSTREISTNVSYHPKNLPKL